MIVLVSGLPGSGKSFFASRLAKMIRAVYINSDQVRKEMFNHRTYSEQEKAAVYNAMLGKVKEAINQSRDVVLDATFHKNDTRESFRQEMEDRCDIYFIEITAKEDLISQRLKRERPDSEANFEVYQLIRRQWEPLRQSHLTLESTDENINYLLQTAAVYLHWNDDKRTDQ